MEPDERTRKRKGRAQKVDHDTPSNIDNNSQDSTKEERKSKVLHQEGETSISTCVRAFKLTSKIVGYFILATVVIPAVLNYAALQQEEAQLKLPGLKYEIGHGQKLHFYCNGTGFPTVLLDGPTGMSTDDWFQISSSLAKITKVCMYDRAGLGFSDMAVRESPQAEHSDENPENLRPKFPAPEPYTVDKMSEDVKYLVEYSSQQVEKPFIYIGAELGGLVARHYAQLSHPTVSDVVLLNPVTEELFAQDNNVWERFWYEQLCTSHQTMTLAVSCGMTRIALILGLISPPLIGAANDEILARQKHLMCSPRHAHTTFTELFLTNRSFAQMRTLSRSTKFPEDIKVHFIETSEYDYNLPSQLNQAWKNAVTTTREQYHKKADTSVIQNMDRKMLYKDPEELLKHLKNIIVKRHKEVKGMPTQAS